MQNDDSPRTSRMARLLATPLLRAQRALLLDLVKAVTDIEPQREVFRTIATSTSDKLILMHAGISDEYEGAFLGDLKALAAERLIDIESQVGSDLRFNVMPRGFLVADTLAPTLSDESSTTGRQSAATKLGIRPSGSPSAAAVERGVAVERREWGDRWVALDEQPHATRGQGKIWRVWDRRDEAMKAWQRPQYALKELRYDDSSVTSTKYRRFIREIDQTAKLSHDAIVRVVDHYVPTNDAATLQPYFVMPFAETSLERAKDLAGHLETVLEIGVKLADALATAHRFGVVHRDVKPGNILLFGDERRPALADFGICFLDDGDRLTGVDAETVGSRNFAAPELLGGGRVEDVGARADVYSLGKTLYAAVAGGEIFPRERHRASPWELAVSRNDPRLAHLHGLLDRMVVERPDERFSTMEDCRAQLERALYNVRHGVPYSVGMYGAGGTPVERADRLNAALQGPPGIARSDTMHVEVDAAIREAHETAGPNAPRAASYREDPATHATIVQSANALASAGIPLLVHGETDAFADWLSAVVEPIHRMGPEHHRSRSRSILRAAAVLSLHAVAAVAWRRHRWNFLRQIVDTVANAPDKFVHLDHLSDSAGALYPWLMETLATMAVLRRMEAETVQEISSLVSMVAGVVSLIALHRLPPERTQAALSPDAVGCPVSYPAFAEPSWIPRLAALLYTRAKMERDLARGVFDMSAQELRSFAASVTLIVGRCVVRANPSRMTEWGLDVDPEGHWNRWVSRPAEGR